MILLFKGFFKKNGNESPRKVVPGKKSPLRPGPWAGTYGGKN